MTFMPENFSCGFQKGMNFHLSENILPCFMLYESCFVVLCISGYCNHGYKSLYALTFSNTVLI